MTHGRETSAMRSKALALSLAILAAFAAPDPQEKKMPVLESTTQKFLDDLRAAGGPPIYSLKYEEARKVLRGAQSGPVPKAAVTSEDTSFPVGPSGKVNVRILRPEGATGNLPVVMYYHGGGWVLGDKETHDRLVRELAVGANVAVVFVDYTPAPDAQYPVQNEESYAALKYVSEHANDLKVDATKIAIAGDSAGGQLAISTTLLAKERKGPKAVCQVLFYPVTDAGMETASYNEYAEGIWLTKKAMAWFWDAYVPNKAQRNEITASPLQATTAQLTGLPPALIITDAFDVLRDEGEEYARKLTQAGVPTISARYDATIHDFVMLNALAETSAARGAIEQASAYLRAKLHG
jgi:acetyl esterase